MATSIWLDNALVENAKMIGQEQSRSAAKQIEHWAKIGRMMENNPDLLSLSKQPLTSQPAPISNQPEIKKH